MHDHLFPVSAEQNSSQLQDFRQGDLPPLPPSSANFSFNPTTLFVMVVAPHDLGNAILSFLSEQIVASIGKIRPSKYTIRAETFLEGISCHLKVRIYRFDGGASGGEAKYAVVFQRRSGSAEAFHAVFRQASLFLASRFTCFGLPEQIAEGHQLIPDLKLGVDDIMPLMHMARDWQWPPLQAEAAAAIDRLSRSESALTLLQAPEATAAALRSLFASDSLNVAVPSARALQALAPHAESGPLLGQPGLLLAAARSVKANSGQHRGLVECEFAQTLATAIRHGSRSQEKLQDATELQKVLAEILETMSLQREMTTARTHLEGALFDLNAAVW
jgi:hypothetical protein